MLAPIKYVLTYLSTFYPDADKIVILYTSITRVGD